MFLRNCWYVAAWASEVADAPFARTICGEPVLMFRGPDARAVALEDRCCHRTAALSRGYYEDGALVCGYHGWTYDRSGRVLRIPQMERAAPESARVHSFLAEERYGYAWVCLHDSPLLGVPEIAEWNDPVFRRIPE